jgi:Flp pilus assembly protein TadG
MTRGQPSQSSAEDGILPDRGFAALDVLGGEDGSSMIELAFVVCFFLMPLFVGASEVGMLIYDSIEVTNAASTGALCGMQSPTLAASTAGITAAARADAPDFGANLSVTPTTYWVCAAFISGTRYTTQAAATSACTGNNNQPLEFLKVDTSATITMPLKFPALPSTYTLTGVSVQEVVQ